MQQPARQVERINIFQGKLDSKKLTKLPDTHRPVRDLRMSIPCDFQCYYICSYILAIYLFGGGFPGGSVVKSPPAKQKTWVRSLSWEVPQTEEPGGLQRVAKSRTRLNNYTVYLVVERLWKQYHPFYKWNLILNLNCETHKYTKGLL